MPGKKKIIALALTGWLGLLCIQGLAQGHVTTVTDFNVPEYDTAGNLVSELMGDYADILPDGRVRVRGLNIISYRDGQEDLTITSPACEYDERDKTAHSDQEVRIARDNLVVTGRGFSWNSADERMEIHSNVRVVMRNVQQQVHTGETQ